MELPEDNFGVLVENDIDHKRLLWLVNRVGEQKVRMSVAKYVRRYPQCQPFVSVLLKWYDLTVPTAVYLPVRRPIYGVYALTLADGSAVKIGWSGAWTRRAASFVPWKLAFADVFDLDCSCFRPTASKPAARDMERELLANTAHERCDAPLDGRSGRVYVVSANGQREWRHGRALRTIERLLAEGLGTSPMLTLRTALTQEAILDSALTSIRLHS
jgi:hypothetical protein